MVYVISAQSLPKDNSPQQQTALSVASEEAELQQLIAAHGQVRQSGLTRTELGRFSKPNPKKGPKHPSIRVDIVSISRIIAMSLGISSLSRARSQGRSSRQGAS